MLFCSVLHLSLYFDMCMFYCCNCFIFVGSRLYMHAEELVSTVWASVLWDWRLVRSFSFRQCLMLSISNSLFTFWLLSTLHTVFSSVSKIYIPCSYPGFSGSLSSYIPKHLNLDKLSASMFSFPLMCLKSIWGVTAWISCDQLFTWSFLVTEYINFCRGIMVTSYHFQFHTIFPCLFSICIRMPLQECLLLSIKRWYCLSGSG